MFYFSEVDDLAVAQIPKAGLMSIREWLGPRFKVVPNDAARAASRRVAFIRQPMERLASCYSMLYWMHEYEPRHRSNVPIESWDAFVDHVLGGARNEHWIPQVEHCGDIPNIYRQFERLPDCFEEFRPGMLPHSNRCSRRPTSPYRERELGAYYAADFEKWEAAWP
jgi:hypothetical protein